MKKYLVIAAVLMAPALAHAQNPEGARGGAAAGAATGAVGGAIVGGPVGAGGELLLVAQGFDGAKLGRAVGRVAARDETDDETDREGDHDDHAAKQRQTNEDPGRHTVKLGLLMANDALVIAGRSFGSRLFLGTGKFPSNASLRDAIVASGSEMVTVAMRRADPSADDDIVDAIPPNVLLLTNTSGAMNADEAVRIARLARAAQLSVPRNERRTHHGDAPRMASFGLRRNRDRGQPGAVLHQRPCLGESAPRDRGGAGGGHGTSLG